MKSLAFLSMLVVCGVVEAAPIAKTVPKAPVPIVPIVPSTSTKIDLPPIAIPPLPQPFPHIFGFDLTIERRISNPATAGLPENVDKKPFVAQFSVMPGDTSQIRNTTSIWYLDGGKSVSVDDSEELSIRSEGDAKVFFGDNVSYCFTMSYDSQMVSSFVMLTPENRRPVMNIQRSVDTVCLKYGESRTYFKNLRMQPTEWKITLNRVVLDSNVRKPATPDHILDIDMGQALKLQNKAEEPAKK